VLFRSGAVIEKAKENIENAGLSDTIIVRKNPFECFKKPSDTGTLICNPPYGLRIEPKDILSMYQKMGDVMKQELKGWTCWIFTGNLEVAKFIGLRTTRKIPLYNGPIECRFLKYEIYDGSKKAKKQTSEDDL